MLHAAFLHLSPICRGIKKYGLQPAFHVSLLVLLRYTHESTGNDTNWSADSRSDPCMPTGDGCQRGPARGSHCAATQGSLLGGSQARTSKREHGYGYCR